MFKKTIIQKTIGQNALCENNLLIFAMLFNTAQHKT